ncbi:TIGR02391 family protein [Apilactobacillus xinyiensis]|uniref:TIGR02391 family protein n=1 Tax=Apilactobacillus xinyiensis TaxID=2841032 RepID=UPI0033651003
MVVNCLWFGEIIIKNNNHQLVENISKIMGEELTGSKVTTMFNDIGLKNYDADRPYNSTKWRRIKESIISSNDLSSSLFKVIEYVCQPRNYIAKENEWNKLRHSVNQQLIFEGFELDDSGKVIKTYKSRSFSDAKRRLKSFQNKLDSYNIHSEVLKFCKEEYLNENYFYAIFEASKGLLSRIRKISEIDEDGNKLINEAFNIKNPIILIKNNFMSNDNEVSKYNGLKSLLKTIVYIYRNPKAHTPKLYDPSSETDAITAFTLMSLAHRNLDNCVSKRYANF